MTCGSPGILQATRSFRTSSSLTSRDPLNPTSRRTSLLSDMVEAMLARLREWSSSWMRTPLRRLAGVTVTVEKLLSLELLDERRWEEPTGP